MEEENGVSQGLILGCPIALALVLVAVLLILVVGAAVLGLGAPAVDEPSLNLLHILA